MEWESHPNGLNMGIIKYTIPHIKESLNMERYTLISSYYKNTKTKLESVCSNGHNYTFVWDSWLSGHRCGQCNGTHNVITYDEIKRSFETEGYTIISTEYKNNTSPLFFVCPKGHTHYIGWNNWKKGQRCGRCKGNLEVTYDQVKQSIESVGYRLLSEEYKNNKSKLICECNNGHIFNIKWSHWRDGHRCGLCPTLISKPEQDIVDYIQSNTNYNIITNDRSIIKNPLTGFKLELDIYLPEINKAIEFNGKYWHSLEKVIQRDTIKRLECNKLGIDLLVIEEQLWIDDRYGCIKNIDDFLVLRG